MSGNTNSRTVNTTNLDPDRIQYIAFKLDADSFNYLLRLFEQRCRKWNNAPVSKLYCDHVTLAYGPDEIRDFFDRGLGNLLGKEFEISMNGVIGDHNCVAAMVDWDSVIPLGVHNMYPHITMATYGGTKPVYSNTLIRDYMEGNRPVHFIAGRYAPLSGTVQCIPKKDSKGELIVDIANKMEDSDVIS